MITRRYTCFLTSPRLGIIWLLYDSINVDLDILFCVNLVFEGFDFFFSWAVGILPFCLSWGLCYVVYVFGMNSAWYTALWHRRIPKIHKFLLFWVECVCVCVCVFVCICVCICAQASQCDHINKHLFVHVGYLCLYVWVNVRVWGWGRMCVLTLNFFVLLSLSFLIRNLSISFWIALTSQRGQG